MDPMTNWALSFRSAGRRFRMWIERFSGTVLAIDPGQLQRLRRGRSFLVSVAGSKGSMRLLERDEARRIAVNIAKLQGLLQRTD
jgi:hypothetical protein